MPGPRIPLIAGELGDVVVAIPDGEAGARTEGADLDDLLCERLEHIGDLLHVDGSAVLMADGDDSSLVVRAVLGALGGLESGAELAIDDIDAVLEERGVRERLAAPMRAGDEPLGLLQVGRARGPAFGAADARLLRLLADRVALEIRQGGVLRRHTKAWTMQRSLLPPQLPDVPGIALAASYLPAAGAGIGGDWYDVIPLYDGRVGLAIGDVVGRGPEAAAFMAELRGALRAYAVEAHTAADVAERMWRFVGTLGPGRMATFLYAILDPGDGSLRFVSAAHPAPLILTPEGRTFVAEQLPAAPLGRGTSAHHEEQVVHPPPGSTFVLYTDGLVERRGERLRTGLRRLVAAAATAPREPDALCTELVTRMLGRRRPEDDVALLAVRAAPALADDLRMTVAAHPDRLTGLRRLMGRWLSEAGAGPEEIATLTLAFHEACANAVEHAYGPAEATFDVCATRQAGTVELTVRDHGRWRAPRGQDRGRGTCLMRQIVDEVTITPEGDGTTVRLRHHLDGG